MKRRIVLEHDKMFCRGESVCETETLTLIHWDGTLPKNPICRGQSDTSSLHSTHSFVFFLFASCHDFVLDQFVSLESTFVLKHS